MAQNDPNPPRRGGIAGALDAYAQRTPTVSDHTVYLDGASYTGTRFVNCTMVYSGGTLPFLVNNEYQNCDWRLDGAASNTLDFMKFLISIGGRDLVLNGLGIGAPADGSQG